MDESYQNVVDTAELVWTLFAYLIHGAMVFVQVGLGLFLVGTGVQSLMRPDGAGSWGRLGVAARGRGFGALRIALGLSLFAPLAIGAPVLVSLAAGIGAFVLLWWTERRLSVSERSIGVLVRRGGLALAAATALFMVWEREDGLALAADVLLPALEWRSEELSWQLDSDPMSPKVGDLAPDFELKDPEGVTQVRLSDFRGKRPVALVFGSYT
jgi:hypothetical protein